MRFVQASSAAPLHLCSWRAWQERVMHLRRLPIAARLHIATQSPAGLQAFFDFMGEHIFQGHKPDRDLAEALDCFNCTDDDVENDSARERTSSPTNAAAGSGRVIETHRARTASAVRDANGDLQPIAHAIDVGNTDNASASGVERQAVGSPELATPTESSETSPCTLVEVFETVVEWCAAEMDVPVDVFETLALNYEAALRRASAVR